MKKTKIVKIGIIGAGTWGENHAKIYMEHPMVEVRAICDVHVENAQKLALSLGLPDSIAYSDHQDMLREAELDAVAIVTPDFAHYKIAIDCAKEKKHIIIEKPLTTNSDQAREIIKTVEENDVRLMVDLHSRWSPLFHTAKQAIDRGEIGTLQHAYLRLNDTIFVPMELLKWSAKSSVLWFLGYHAVDLLRWYFGDEVEKVYAASRKTILAEKGIDTADVYQMILHFKNGGIVTLENSWVIPNTHPNINDIKVNLVGDKGMINVDPTNSAAIETYTEQTYKQPDYIVSHSIFGQLKGFAYESIRHFIDCLVTGNDFQVTLTDAYNTTVVIEALIQSAETGQVVEVFYD